MSKTLAELRAEKAQPASLPTHLARLCLDQKVLANIQRLTAEKHHIEITTPAPVDDDEKQTRPRRAGEGVNPRLAQIDAELEAEYDAMREAEGELLLQAGEGGAWLRWKDDHPPREGNESDERLAYGLCNAADLMDDLGSYVVSWNGDDFGPGEWDDWFKAKVAPADLGALVNAVVAMHESRILVPKSSTGSSKHLTSVTDSDSPAV